MLDERSSKIRKENVGYSRDVKLTQKIYAKLDKRASESITGKGKGLIRKSLLSDANQLTSEEIDILKVPHEIALRYDNKAKLVKVIQGDEQQVTIPRTAEGDTVSHNHPGGLGPSSRDLLVVLTNSMHELRIVSNQEGINVLYRLIAKSKITKKDAKRVSDFYVDSMRDKYGVLKDSSIQRDEALDLTLEAFSDMFFASKQSF